jgi:hypothetical protein
MLYTFNRNQIVLLGSFQIELQSKGLKYILFLLKTQKGKLDKKQWVHLSDTLNDLYWNKAHMLPQTRDALRNFYTEVIKMKPDRVPSKPSMRDKLLEIKKQQELRKNLHASGDDFMDLKKQLIRLGHSNPSLRDAITPVLATLTKEATQVKTSAVIPTSAYGYLSQYFVDLHQNIAKRFARHPSRKFKVVGQFKDPRKMEWMLIENRSTLFATLDIRLKGDKIEVKGLSDYGHFSLNCSLFDPMEKVASDIIAEINELL